MKRRLSDKQTSLAQFFSPQKKARTGAQTAATDQQANTEGSAAQSSLGKLV
jgi:hypothetical protein